MLEFARRTRRALPSVIMVLAFAGGCLCARIACLREGHGDPLPWAIACTACIMLMSSILALQLRAEERERESHE
jgi:hypothetical protein